MITALLEHGLSPVSFDAPGHGDSGGRTTTILEYRDILAELHRRHGAFEAVVAHSFGVTSAFLAVRDGVRADRLVAIGGVPDFAHLVDRFCALPGLRPRPNGELRSRVENLLFPGGPAMRERFSALHQPDRIPARVLVIHDEGDDMVPLEQGRRVAGAYADRSRLITTSGLGHRRIVAAPEVVAAITDFVRAPSPAGTTPEPAPPGPVLP